MPRNIMDSAQCVSRIPEPQSNPSDSHGNTFDSFMTKNNLLPLPESLTILSLGSSLLLWDETISTLIGAAFVSSLETKFTKGSVWQPSEVVRGLKGTMIPVGSGPLTLPSHFRIKDAYQKALYTRNGQLLVGDPDSENCEPGELLGAFFQELSSVHLPQVLDSFLLLCL